MLVYTSIGWIGGKRKYSLKNEEKNFEAIAWCYVDASKTHGNGEEYYVAVGKEHWGNKDAVVLKIQMSYDHKRSGRKSVSYPIDPGNASKDWEKCVKWRKKQWKNMLEESGDQLPRRVL